MRLKIFHAVAPAYRHNALTGQVALAASLDFPDTVPVAQALADAFRLTQNGDDPWDVMPIDNLTPGNGPQRSTAIGDIAIIDDQDAYRCERSDWHPIPLGHVVIVPPAGSDMTDEA